MHCTKYQTYVCVTKKIFVRFVLRVLSVVKVCGGILNIYALYSYSLFIVETYCAFLLMMLELTQIEIKKNYILRL